METKRQRKPKYELGREEAITEFFTVLSMAIDVHPRPISPTTLSLITDDLELATRIDEQLKRYRSIVIAEVRKTKGIEVAS